MTWWAAELCTATVPLPPSADTAAPEAARLDGQDRLGTSGRLPPAGYTVTLPPWRPLVTATASATAPTAEVGTPPCPATGTVTVWPAPTWTLATCLPASGTKPPPADPAGSESSEVSDAVVPPAGADDAGLAEPAG